MLAPWNAQTNDRDLLQSCCKGTPVAVDLVYMTRVLLELHSFASYIDICGDPCKFSDPETTPSGGNGGNGVDRGVL